MVRIYMHRGKAPKLAVDTAKNAKEARSKIAKRIVLFKSKNEGRHPSEFHQWYSFQ